MAKITQDEYREWLLEQTSPEYELIQTDDRHIRLETDYAVSEIVFYKDEIIEISVTSSKDGSLKYYLHFQLQDDKHAKDMFTEMTEALLELKNSRKMRVLFSCTSAATTTFFAAKLNDLVQQLELDYEFDAVSYKRLFEKAPEYDVIVLAPQIGYLYKKLKASIPEKLVLQFPTAVFAAFDSMKTLEFIRDEVKKNQEKPAEKKVMIDKPCHCSNTTKKNILCIAVIQDDRESNCYYRLYHGSEVLLHDFVKRPATADFTTQIVDDIIDYAMALSDHIDLIGLALPGIVGDAQTMYSLPNSNFIPKSINLAKDLKARYGVDTLIFNNANATVQGYAYAHPEYENISYYSQPYGCFNGGSGNILNGKLVTGLAGIAGETLIFSDRLQYSNKPEILAKTDVGQLELVTNILVTMIGLIGPEIIVLRAPMVNDMDELHKNLMNFVPEEYIPKLDYLPDASYCMLDGVMGLCLDHLKQHANA